MFYSDNQTNSHHKHQQQKVNSFFFFLVNIRVRGGQEKWRCKGEKLTMRPTTCFWVLFLGGHVSPLMTVAGRLQSIPGCLPGLHWLPPFCLSVSSVLMRDPCRSLVFFLFATTARPPNTLFSSGSPS